MSNLENKVNDIAKAIQDFSQNQFATKTDLNRAFNELISSLNTISDASNEKFSTQFLEHIRYLADERNKYLQDNLQAFETSMKELADNVDSKNFSYEVKRFSKELEDVRNKIEEQEHIFVNLSRLVEDLSNKSDTRASFEEIKDNLDDLSKGFEGVTSILNKKFSNFVSEVKKINNDQAFIDINLRLDGVLKTSNMIISAIDVIDEKYQDIKSVIEFVTNNESALSRAVSELNKTTDELNGVMPQLKAVTTKGDLIVLEDKINSINSFIDAFKDYVEATNEQTKEETLENLVFIKNKILEMQGGGINSLYDVIKDLNSKITSAIENSQEELKKSITGQIVYGNDQIQDKFKEGFLSLQENIKDVNLGINNLDNTLTQRIGYETSQIRDTVSLLNKNVSDSFIKLRELLGEDILTRLEPIKEKLDGKDAKDTDYIRQIVSSNVLDLKEILNKHIIENGVSAEIIESIEKEIKTVLIGVIDLKNELKNGKDDNSSLIKNCVRDVIQNLDTTLSQNDKLSSISDAISNFSIKLEESFQKLRTENDAKGLNAENEIVERLNAVIPKIVYSLDEAKTQVMENSTRVHLDIKKDVEAGTLKIKEDIEAVSLALRAFQTQLSKERGEEIKAKFDDASNLLNETIKALDVNLGTILSKNTENLAELSKQIEEYNTGLQTKIGDVRSLVEVSSIESKRDLTEAITSSASKYVEHLNIIADNILSKMSLNDDAAKENIALLENKIRENTESIFNHQTQTLNEEITNFSSKLDKVNLQQIGSAKELSDNISTLSAIQNSASEGLKAIILKIEEKLNQENENAVDKEQITALETSILQNLKDEFTKQIQSFNTGFARIANLNKTKENDFAIVNEQIDLLSKTLTQEFKSEFQKQYQAVVNGFARIINKQEEAASLNSEIPQEQIDFILKSIDQGFKAELQKNQQLLIEDISRILNSPKNRDANITALSERINLFSKTITQDFKSELQAQQEALVSDITKISNSQKSAEDNLQSLTDKIELFSKAVSTEVSNELQTQQRILVEDLAKIASLNKDQEETIFDIREKLRTFEENVVQNVKNETELLQKAFLGELREFKTAVLDEDFNKKQREEIEKTIENIGQSILQEVRNELQTQQRILLNDLTKFESDFETGKNSISALNTQVADFSKSIELKVEEEAQKLQTLVAANLTASSKIQELEEETSLKLEQTVQDITKDFDEKIKKAKDDLLSEIRSIYIPEAIDENALKSDINASVDNALYVLQGEIDRVKDKVEEEVSKIIIPEYNDSSIKALLNELSEKVTSSKFDDTELKDGLRYLSGKISDIKIPEKYNDEDLKDKINELKEKIESIDIPKYDDSEVKALLNELSDAITLAKFDDTELKDGLRYLSGKISDIKIPEKYNDEDLKDKINELKEKIESIDIPKYDDSEVITILNSALDIISSIKSPDFNKEEITHEINVASDVIRLNLKEEFAKQLSGVIRKIEDIYIPEIDEARIIDNISTSVSTVSDDIKSEVRELNYDLKEDLKDYVLNIKNEFEKVQDTVINEVSALETSLADNEIKKHISTSINQIVSNISELKNGVENKISSIQIPEQIDENELRLTLIEAVNSISEKINEELTSLRNRISEIKIPDEIDVEDLKGAINSDIKEASYHLNQKLDDIADRLGDKISDIEIPEQQDLRQFKEDICEDTKNFINNLKIELEATTNIISSQISQIKIPDSEILKEDINSNTNNALCVIQNKIDDLNIKIKEKIEDIEIPEQYNDTGLKQELYNGVQNVIENVKQELENYQEKTRDIISSIQIPEQYDDSDLKNELQTVKNHIEDIRNDILSKMDRVDNVPDSEFFKKHFDNINNEIEVKLDKLEEKIKERIGLIKLPQDIDKDELINTITTNIRGLVYDINNKTQDFKELYENNSKQIADKLDKLKPITASELEENTDTIIGVIREKLKESTYIQNKFVNGQLAELLETISANDTDYVLQKIFEKLEVIQGGNEYSLRDVEEDIRNVKIAVDKTNSIDMIKNLSAVKNLTGENIKLNQHVEQQLIYTNNWLRGAAKAMEVLIQKLDMQEGEKEPVINMEKFENAAINLAQKYKLQERRLDDIDVKINSIIKKQDEGIDISPIVKSAQESTKQTNSLMSRMDALEGRMDAIQKSLERIVEFIES